MVYPANKVKRFDFPQGRVVADGTPDDVALRFGGANLEGAFLKVASEAYR